MRCSDVKVTAAHNTQNYIVGTARVASKLGGLKALTNIAVPKLAHYEAV